MRLRMEYFRYGFLEPEEVSAFSTGLKAKIHADAARRDVIGFKALSRDQVQTYLIPLESCTSAPDPVITP